MTRLVLAPLFLLTCACSDRPPTVIDGSSPEAFANTTKQARREIPDADRLAFDRALRTVGSRRHAERDVDALARVTFNGMTGAEIVAEQKMRDTMGSER